MDEVDGGRRQTVVLLCLGSGRLHQDLMRCLHAVGAVGVVAATSQHADDLCRALAVDIAVLDDAFLRAEPRGLRVVAAAEAPVVHVGQAPSPAAAVATLPPDSAAFEIALEVQRLGRDLVDGIVRWGPLTLDARRRACTWNDVPLQLTPTQFRLMATLVNARGSVVTRPELCRRSLGSYVHGDCERLDAHLRRIRRLIEPDPSRARFLLTVRGEGVRLADPASLEITLASPRPPELVREQVVGA